MKWINLLVKNVADYIYMKLPSVWYQNNYFTQKQKKRNMILKCLCPHVECVAP